MDTHPWTVEVLSRAEVEIKDLPGRLRREALELLQGFEENPFPPDSVPLVGHAGLYRVRLEGYRILYRVSVKRRQVLVIRVRPRSVAYRGLEAFK